MGSVVSFTLDISPLGESPRTVWVYLPASYEFNKTRKYPVLYMFDGHNLFFDELATYGKSWGIKKYLDENNLDLVVVGQDCNHTGFKRMDEYCPLKSERISDLSGTAIQAQGDITGEWFVKVLKKECESRFRIYHDRRHVGIGGSSMGGLMGLYMVTRYNKIYAKAACLSPAINFNNRGIRKLIASSKLNPDTRIYMDLGSDEVGGKKGLTRAIDTMLSVAHDFTSKGCDSYPRLIVNGTHSEASWETAVPVFLAYLFPEIYENK